MQPIINTKSLPLLIILLVLSGCRKDWLEVKPTKSSIVFSTLQEYQSLIDDKNYPPTTPALGEIGSDNYYMTQSTLATLSRFYINSYTWAPQGWEETITIFDWLYTYKSIYNANTCLEGILKIEKTKINAPEWDNVKGSAHFIRGMAFYNLASLFAQPYDMSQAGNNNSAGVPLRLSTDPWSKIGRGTVEELYRQILLDLKTSIDFLPDMAEYQVRPNKRTSFGMLSRVYLSMGAYDSALVYANKYLQISSTLIDYNNLPTTGSTSMPSINNNIEVIYATKMHSNFLTQPRTNVDSNLLKMYAPDDLRINILFRSSAGRTIWSGSYTGAVAQQFTGLATDEILLTRAECYARNGNLDLCLKDLNDLLRKRIRKNQFKEVTAPNEYEALKLVLAERRKELLFRGIRWTDLRRLNKDPRFAITIKRYYNNIEYVLLPNENKYVFPITSDEISNSGIGQNPR